MTGQGLEVSGDLWQHIFLCFWPHCLEFLTGPEWLVGSVWARGPQCRRFDPPLGKFSSRGDFSLGVNMGSNSIPPKTLSDESIN